MKVITLIAGLLISSVATAGVMPWGIKSKLSLGMEKEDLPYMPEELQKHYDLGLEFSDGYVLSRSYGLNSEWKVKYLYENWYEHEGDEKDGHTYRLEYHVHF